MINYALEIVVFIFLLVMAIFDIKHKKVISVIPTSIIFILAILRYNYIGFGILAGIFGIILYEVGVFKGIADLKAVIILGLMIPSLPYFFVLMCLIPLHLFLYQLFLLKVFKFKKNQEIPLLPAFLNVYITLILIITFTCERFINMCVL